MFIQTKMQLTLLMVINVILVVNAAHDSKFCQLTTKKDNDKLPVLDSKFYVSSCAQYTTEGLTNDVYEYTDIDNKMDSIFVVAKDTDKQMVYNYNTQQSFTVDFKKRPDAKDACIVSGIPKDSKVIGSTFSKLLRLSVDEPKEFKGLKPIRGINVNHWYACVYNADTDVSSMINYYYSDPSTWIPSGPQAKVVPVRITVEQKYNSDLRYFNRTFDVTRYRAGLPSSQYPFQVPQGYYCEGLLTNRPLPTMPTAFSYTAEVINRYSASLTTLRERYNFQVNLSRSDFSTVPGDPDEQRFGKGRLTKIYDFRRGIKYVKNHDIGNCSVQMLDKDDRDSTKDGRLIDPSAFFKMDDVKTLHYKGPQVVRGQVVDVYIVRRQGYGVDPIGNTTFEWGFATENGAIQQFIKPVWMYQVTYATSNSDGSSFSYNYYDYSSAVPDFWNMDLNMCFQTNAQKHYTVHLTMSPGAVDTILNYQVANFKTEFALAVGKQIEVSLIRISDIDLIQDNKGLLVEFSLHDAPPNAVGDRSGEPLDIADALLVYAVKNKIQLNFLSGSDTLEPAIIDPDSLIELQIRPKYITDLGYTSGDMAVVGIVLLLLAIITGALVGFLFWLKPASGWRH